MKINTSFVHYALAIACLKGISLLMLPIVTRFLPPDSYGVLNFLVSVAAMLSIILGFGMAEMMFQFTAKIAASALDSFIAQCVKFTMCVSCLFLLIAIAAADIWLALLPLKVEASHFILLMINLAVSSVLAIYLTRYRILQQSKPYMLVALCQGVLQACFTYILLSFNFGIFGVLLSGCLVTTMVTISLVLVHRRLLFCKEPFLSRKHFRYGSHIALSALFLYGLGGAENWFIASALGPSQLAFYFIATQFSLALSLAFEPFRLWWFPVRFKRFESNPELAAKGAVMGCFIITLLALFMMIFAPFMMTWLLPSHYHGSADYIAILCLILVIKTYAELLNLGCYLDKYTGYVPLINGVCAVIALVSIARTTTFYGINGVFFGLLLAHTLRFLAFYLISQRIARLRYQFTTLAVVFSLLVLHLVLAESIWLNIGLLTLSVLFAIKFLHTHSLDKVRDRYEYS
ncbi:lipopolysaccharide biosynthesis protein [Pseudoalteromonas sp.]|uniref:lipopolysaccharide biosynthesis protein n=1 Tax=Pseudoalteromonas sp. TaxID=53249 RepID=UPI00356314F5